MKLEKRSADTSAPVQESAPAHKGRSHILIYILILFIAAFLLMALSFLSSQHSNEQMMGLLNTNASTLESLQTALEENLRLQSEADSLRSQLETLNKDLETLQAAAADTATEKEALLKKIEQQKESLTQLQQQLSATDALSQLQQLFIGGKYEACQSIIADMESTGLAKHLPTAPSAPGGAAPSQLYLQLKSLIAATPKG